MDLLKKFGVDSKAEQEGTWIEVSPRVPAQDGKPEIPASRILIARLGSENRKWSEFMSSLVRKEMDLWNADPKPAKGDAPEVQAQKAAIRAKQTEAATRNTISGLVECIILGWENIEYGGQPLPYSKENARKLMEDPDLRPFREWVIFQAERDSNFKLKLEQDAGEALKNA